MPSNRPTWCRVCGKHETEAGQISWRGKCLDCANTRQTENIEGLASMSGHVRDRWARGMILSAGGLLPERLEKTH